MDTIYYVFILLIGCIVYLCISVWVGKTLKKKVRTQTVSANSLPPLPSVSGTKHRSNTRRSDYLNMSSQRKRRKLFRQSKYLYNKYGIH